jgi:hypothetical protein
LGFVPSSLPGLEELSSAGHAIKLPTLGRSALQSQGDPAVPSSVTEANGAPACRTGDAFTLPALSMGTECHGDRVSWGQKVPALGLKIKLSLGRRLHMTHSCSEPLLVSQSPFVDRQCQTQGLGCLVTNW